MIEPTCRENGIKKIWQVFWDVFGVSCNTSIRPPTRLRRSVAPRREAINFHAFIQSVRTECWEKDKIISLPPASAV